MIYKIFALISFIYVIYALIMLIRAIKTKKFYTKKYLITSYEDSSSNFIFYSIYYLLMLLTFSINLLTTLLLSNSIKNAFLLVPYLPLIAFCPIIFCSTYSSLLLYTGKVIGISNIYTKKERPFFFCFQVASNYLLSILGIFILVFLVTHNLIKF